MTRQALVLWLQRRQGTERPCRPRGRPKVIGPLARWRLRRCYLDHHRQWGPRVLAAWAVREGVGRFSHGAIARVIADLRRPKPKRPKPKRYEVTMPDAMWSEDGAGFREYGRKRELLVLQDEYSRYKVNNRLVAGPAKAQDVCAYLRGAFETHGAPLVLKHDGGAIFHAEQVKELLDEYGVVELTGPRHYPCYNGKKERSIRDIKSYERAMRADLPSSTQSSRVSAAIEDLNENRPRPILGNRTACEVYEQNRKPLPDRTLFRKEVDRREARLMTEASSRAERDSARRRAVEQVLIRYGLLKYDLDLSTYFKARYATS